jgi:hypothetical protein
MAQKVIFTTPSTKGNIMFELLIAVRVAYFREHPEDLAVYHAQGRGEMALDLAQRMTTWVHASPEWNKSAIMQRLDEETRQLMQASPHEQERYFTAANYALVQLEHGEHD